MMGTRGFVGVVVDGDVKISYQQYDSYPSGVGMDTLNWLRGADLGRAHEQARVLKLVPEDGKPSEAEREQFAGTHQNVSTGDDWYSLLRGNQGNVGAILETGVATDASYFPMDSLFCEWGYLVDFDAGRFEVYKGFQQALPQHGRWAGQEEKPGSDYKAVERVGAWDLNALPSDEEFLLLEKQDGDDE